MPRYLRQNPLHHGSHRRPLVLHGRFTLNGGSDPTVVSGVLRSVKRYETAGADPFFRLELDNSYQLANSGAVKIATVEGPIAADLTPQFGSFTSNPLVEPVPLKEVDIVIKDGGIPVDTSGVVVHVVLHLDLAPRTA